MPHPRKTPTVIIVCRVLQSLLQELAPAEAVQNAVFMDYGLHRQPAKMTRELQEKIDGIKETSLILLGYGLCGKGLAGIKSGRRRDPSETVYRLLITIIALLGQSIF